MKKKNGHDPTLRRINDRIEESCVRPSAGHVLKTAELLWQLIHCEGDPSTIPDTACVWASTQFIGMSLKSYIFAVIFS